MEIVTANDKDYEDVTKLYYLLYPKRGKGSIDKFNGVDFQSKIFLAKENDRIVGFVITTHISYAKSKSGYIEELFVDQNFRTIGAGKALINKALDWQKSLDSEVVFVTTDEAQEFYKKLGFRELARNSWLCWVPMK